MSRRLLAASLMTLWTGLGTGFAHATDELAVKRDASPLAQSIRDAVLKRLPGTWEGELRLDCGNAEAPSVQGQAQQIDVRTLQFGPKPAEGTAHVTLRGESNRPAMGLRVPFCLTGRIELPVAARFIEAGEWLTESAVSTEFVAIRDVDLRTVRLRGEMTRQRASTPIGTGQPVTGANTQIGREVERGERVKAVMNTGAVAIETEAVALVAAAMGQRTVVRTSHSSTAIPAVVVGPARVELRENIR